MTHANRLRKIYVKKGHEKSTQTVKGRQYRSAFRICINNVCESENTLYFFNVVRFTVTQNDRKLCRWIQRYLNFYTKKY